MTEEKCFACTHPGCLCKSVRTSHLRQHVKSHSQSSQLSAPQHACSRPGCSYKSHDLQVIRRHVQSIHDHVKAFECTIACCDFRSAWAGHLKRHVKAVHEDSFPLKSCDQPGCHHKSKQKGDLKRHQLTVHQNIKRYACHVCAFACFDKSSLKMHMKIHESSGHDVSKCADC